MNPQRRAAKSKLYPIEVSIRQNSENENGKKSQLKVILQKYQHKIQNQTIKDSCFCNIEERPNGWTVYFRGNSLKSPNGNPVTKKQR